MKRRLIFVIALLISMPLLAETKSRYLVQMRQPMEMTNLAMIRDAAQSSSHDVRTYPTFDVIAADLTESEAKALQQSSDVRYLSRVVERHIELETIPRHSPFRPTTTTSPYVRAQQIPYGLDLIHAREVWPATRGGNPTIHVAVIDTGIDYNHPDLKGQILGGYNVFSKTEEPMDDNGHGTHVSGTLAAVDNSIGVVGVAPDIKLWGVKVLRSNGSGTDETVIAGVEWVLNKKKEIGGNWIMSLSLGASDASDIEREAFARAIDDGILVVAAAGNRAVPVLDVPAIYQGVLAVSAIDKDSKPAVFSSYGPGVAFAGPGVNVVSTVPVSKGFEAYDIETENGALINAPAIGGSPYGEVTADAVVCGFGAPEEFPVDAKGKIALIRRSPPGSTFYFRDKVRNALNAGAIGVVMMQVDDRTDLNWTVIINTEDNNTKWPVMLGVLKEEGDQLVAKAGKEKLTLSYRVEEYVAFSGTSMATPHVSAAAALAWSLAPNATAEEVRLAMKLTADDLGAPGYDDFFGYGRVDAIAAAKYLAPAVFNVPPPPPLDPKRKRQGH